MNSKVIINEFSINLTQKFSLCNHTAALSRRTFTSQCQKCCIKPLKQLANAAKITSVSATGIHANISIFIILKIT